MGGFISLGKEMEVFILVGKGIWFYVCGKGNEGFHVRVKGNG